MTDNGGFGDEPRVLGFNAFEPVGFFASISVALYSFVRNPEGIQGEESLAEYDVYAGWRRAFTVILAHTLMMLAVLIYIILNNTSARATFWVGALMLAPWAPVAGQVRNTITAWPRVREMMRSRLTRNELAAILRERFMIGQRALSVAAVVHYAYGGEVLPTAPGRALREHPALKNVEREICAQAVTAMETEEKDAAALGIFWTVDQGPQPRDIGHVDRVVRFYLSWLDPLVFVWTKRLYELPCSPFPEFSSPLGSIGAQARILDVIDSLQQGGTIGEKQMTRAMVGRHCMRCRLATRGAVEAFMESSVKSHGDLRPSTWLLDIGTDWRGGFERIINIMNESCFMGEARGERVPSAEDLSPSYGDRSKGMYGLYFGGRGYCANLSCKLSAVQTLHCLKANSFFVHCGLFYSFWLAVTTMKIFALLFVICRSLFNEFGEGAAALQEVQNIVARGLHTDSWWKDFWDRVAAKHGYDSMSPDYQINISDDSRGHFKAALRDSVDADMKQIVAALVRDPIKKSICGDAKCELSQNSKLLFRVCHPPSN